MRDRPIITPPYGPSGMNQGIIDETAASNHKVVWLKLKSKPILRKKGVVELEVDNGVMPGELLHVISSDVIYRALELPNKFGKKGTFIVYVKRVDGHYPQITEVERAVVGRGIRILNRKTKSQINEERNDVLFTKK